MTADGARIATPCMQASQVHVQHLAHIQYDTACTQDDVRSVPPSSNVAVSTDSQVEPSFELGVGRHSGGIPPRVRGPDIAELQQIEPVDQPVSQHQEAPNSSLSSGSQSDVDAAESSIDQQQTETELAESDDDLWPENEGGTVLGVLREMREEALVPPLSTPQFAELQRDLEDQLAKVKLERYTFPDEEEAAIEGRDYEHSNPQDLPSTEMCWRHTGDYQVSANMPNSISCREYAYHHMMQWRRGSQVTKQQIESNLAFNAYGLQKRSVELNGPGRHNNRFPPSVYACKEILMVPQAESYEFHVCPRGCVHWWAFMQSPSEHLRHCQGCKLCVCPHCKSQRYVLPPGGQCKLRQQQHVEPAQKCWFFFDVFYHSCMDEDWVSAVLHSRKNSLSSFHQSPEESRLNEALIEHAFAPEKVLLPCLIDAAPFFRRPV